MGKPIKADFQRAKQERIVAMANARGVMADQTVVVKQGDGHLFRYTPEVGLDPVWWYGAFTLGKLSLVELQHGTKYDEEKSSVTKSFQFLRDDFSLKQTK